MWWQGQSIDFTPGRLTLNEHLSGVKISALFCLVFRETSRHQEHLQLKVASRYQQHLLTYPLIIVVKVMSAPMCHSGLLKLWKVHNCIFIDIVGSYSCKWISIGSVVVSPSSNHKPIIELNGTCIPRKEILRKNYWPLSFCYLVVYLSSNSIGLLSELCPCRTSELLTPMLLADPPSSHKRSAPPSHHWVWYILSSPRLWETFQVPE